MTEQPQPGNNESKDGQGKEGLPEGYQPTLRLPEHQPGVAPVSQEPVSQEPGPPATHQFAQPEPPQQPAYPQQPSAARQPGQEHYGQPAQDQGQFSSPYPPIYGQSGTTPYAPGQPAYGQPARQYDQQSPYAQPGSANAYGQPAYYSVPAAPKGLSIASMCCGIAALVGFGFFLLPQLAAVILGHLALRREPAGRGMAIAGLVMGYVAIAVTVLVMVIFGLVIGSARSRGYGV